MHRVVIYSKPGCCLCEEVKAQLTRLADRHAFELHEVNILNDPLNYERLKEEIPVVYIDGKKAFKFHLDEGKFLRRIKAR
ncbi:MAG TPA: glutaredoxin family protein [Terriglobia bacterium]|jgi:glutaredoxin|nr:glutaredoxin family protein [Terriglobia bacterium]